MPVIRRGSTYLDVSTTPHAPEGRLKFVPLRSRNIAYKNAICTTLLFICDEQRDLHDAGSPTDSLKVLVVDLKTAMRSQAEAAGLKLGSYKYTKLKSALEYLSCCRYIELPSTKGGNNKNQVEYFDILPSFRDIYKGFQETLDTCGALSARNKYRAYMSLALKVFGSNRPLTVSQAVKFAVERAKRCEYLERSTARRLGGAMGTHYSRKHLPPGIGDVSVQMDEDEPTRVAVDQVNDVGVNETNTDFDMELMWPEGSNDDEVGDSNRQIVPVTPIRPLNHNYSNREIGLPTPESLPRRPESMVISLPPVSPSDITPSRNDDHIHFDNQDPQAGSRFGYLFGAACAYLTGMREGFRLSSDILLPEISSLHIRVTDLQTSLTVAEQALTAANKTTAESQSHCLKTLENLGNAQRKIEILEARATNGEAENLGLQQEVVILKGEVSRLQNGVEQIRQFAGSLIPALASV